MKQIKEKIKILNEYFNNRISANFMRSIGFDIKKLEANYFKIAFKNNNIGIVHRRKFAEIAISYGYDPKYLIEGIEPERISGEQPMKFKQRECGTEIYINL